ncbi:hypothetical protein GCM10007036_17710 [Alsobacter metallidurans]|uniref:Uncharacterized protein n=1 Tax=Alsobacter metallidurans TaxID=340221 RepID=A0A917I631_9HYPH|nr:hypothetical protein GCM10007036_17710 [Alsobacter metallidurans]
MRAGWAFDFNKTAAEAATPHPNLPLCQGEGARCGNASNIRRAADANSRRETEPKEQPR